MKRFLRQHSKELLIAIVIVVFTALVGCSTILLSDYSNGLTAQTEDAARQYTYPIRDNVSTSIAAYVADAQHIATHLPSSVDSLAEYFLSALSDKVADVRLFNGTTEYSSYYVPITGTESSLITSAVGDEKPTVTGVFTDSYTSSLVFAVCVPAHESYADSIVVLYYYRALESDLTFATDGRVEPSFVGFCTSGGELLTIHTDGFSLTRHDNIFEVIRNLTNDKILTDMVEKGVLNNDVRTIRIGGLKYIICLDCANVSPGSMYAVSIYLATSIYSEGYRLADTVYAVVIILTLLTAALLVYVVVLKFRSINERNDYEMYDHELGCPTEKKFSIEVVRLLNKNKVTKYAIVDAEIAHFGYFSETAGSKAADESLKYFSKLISKALITDEFYCHGEGARYALLLHCSASTNIETRLKVLASLMSKCPFSANNGFSLKLQFGVYYINRDEDLTIAKMLDCSDLARKSGASKGNQISIYDDSAHQSFLREAEIESTMEASLKAGEFKVFFQPKYNIAQDRADGAEALVRWFNPKTGKFRSPAEFVPLFESNGFIAQIDKYVLVKVCQYFREAAERGYKHVPISVNVSRVTAIQPDFLDFYISTKRKYGIADGFITVEFTESFAYENYSVMKEHVERLHANGFKCSVDDFGSGYSSFEILKALPMDELKLDSFFIQDGISPERDNVLIKTIINLAKDLGMKVTQEGVETRVDAERLRELGCDVIQGYVYSKPLPITDYIAFLNDSSLRHRI